MKGTLVFRPGWECDYGPAGANRARGREADEDEATLSVSSRRAPLGFTVLGSLGEGERPYAYFFALSQERREGVGISRFTTAGTRSRGFRFDNRRGTAFVDPPAPFAGSAHFRRRRHARDSWRGNLSAPLLGLGRVRLAGPGFVAAMVPRLPNFE